jgi:oxygen-independent coproporphyrinogen-3 oxidase
VKLWFKGHDYRYAVEQMMLAMFPGERPEYVERRSEADAAVTLSVGEKCATAVTVLRRAGETYRGCGRRAGTKLGKPELSELVKTSFYRAARCAAAAPEWGMLTGIRPAKISSAVMRKGGSEAGAFRVLTKKYDVSSERARLCIDASRAGLRFEAQNRPEDISLYVGIPFCPTRCSYCSFVSNSVEKSQKLIEPYLEALGREAEATARLVNRLGLRIKTVYLGGGTPTILSAGRLRTLMEKLADLFDLGCVLEYTVEAGRPDTVDYEKFKMLRSMGATRVCVNPQTMNSKVLEAIGRRHSPEDAKTAYAEARRAGIEAINMDLIAGLPSDDLDGFCRSVDNLASGLRPENITVHTLSLKRGSRLRCEGAGVPDARTVSAMLSYAAARLRDEDYVPYYLYRQKFMAGSFENVGWTLPGYEGLYNIAIMEELHTILSLGAGGVTKLVNPKTGRIERIFNPKYPNEYIENTEKLIDEKNYLLSFYSDILI